MRCNAHYYWPSYYSCTTKNSTTFSTLIQHSKNNSKTKNQSLLTHVFINLFTPGHLRQLMTNLKRLPQNTFQHLIHLLRNLLTYNNYYVFQFKILHFIEIQWFRNTYVPYSNFEKHVSDDQRPSSVATTNEPLVGVI